MSADQNAAITDLFKRIREGDPTATAQLLDIAYSELRGIAYNVFGNNSSDNTLQPTAVVNEVCVRLLKSTENNWNDQQHFFRAAAKAMRNILIDHARAKRAEKRGGEGGHVGAVRVSLTLAAESAAPREVDLVALDDALSKLAAMDNRLGQIFELRFLVGLSVDRTAELVGISPRTVEMDTRLIRAWFQKELSS